MAKISWKPGTLMAPLPPVLISCGTMEKPNVMTAAWTGVLCSDPTLVYVSIRPSRYSHEIISKTKEFVINLPTVALAKQIDLCGVKSGRTTDKFKLSGLTAAPCSKVLAPQVLESPISLECRVLEIKHLGTENEPATHDMFLAEVLTVDVDENYLDDNNALHLEKADLLAYAHGFYYALGKQIGKFGWSVEKAKTKRKREERRRSEHVNENKTRKRQDEKHLSSSLKTKQHFKEKNTNQKEKGEKIGRKFKRNGKSYHKNEGYELDERKPIKRHFNKVRTVNAAKTSEVKPSRKMLTLKK